MKDNSSFRLYVPRLDGMAVWFVAIVLGFADPMVSLHVDQIVCMNFTIEICSAGGSRDLSNFFSAFLFHTSL